MALHQHTMKIDWQTYKFVKYHVLRKATKREGKKCEQVGGGTGFLSLSSYILENAGGGGGGGEHHVIPGISVPLVYILSHNQSDQH